MTNGIVKMTDGIATMTNGIATLTDGIVTVSIQVFYDELRLTQIDYIILRCNQVM